MTGYLHALYAESLSEFGRPMLLSASGGWVLKREIDAFSCDAMGIYPLFACENWSGLTSDLENQREKLVALSVVTDPFGDYDESSLRSWFIDVVSPFKSHFVTDLSRPLGSFVADHHSRNARRALRELQVEKCAQPEELLEEWVQLYAVLIKRHNIQGIAQFSRACFARQLRVPGMVCFRALHSGSTVGIVLWYQQREVAYYHLGAYSNRGYELRASFALFRSALEYFPGSGLKWVSLGAAAGLHTNSSDGLTRFKRGWSTGTRTAYLCGRIFDREKYALLATSRGCTDSAYFPAYRRGEFG
jgi:hypothetical protein